MADVLFLFPTHDSYYHKGIAYISGALKHNSFSTDLLTLNLHKDEAELCREIQKKIESSSPGLIAASIMTPHWSKVKPLLSYIKTITGTPILAGGWHPTLSPEDVIQHPAVDYIGLGEGEEATIDLIRRLKNNKDTASIDNIWAKTKSGIVKNKLRPLIQNLDAVPLPDRDLFSFQDLVDRSALSGVGPEGPKRVAVISTGRGCIYNCAYCCNSAYKKVYNNVKPKHYARKRGIDSILSEIEKVRETYDPGWLEFWEEDFISDASWTKEFLKKYRQRFSLPFSILARPNHAQKDEFKWLSDANCRLVYMGIECGNEAYRSRMMKRKITNRQIINAFKSARDNHIATLSFNIVGLPFETVSDIEETIRINEQILPDFFGCYVFTPFPGTELYDISLKNGLLKDNITPLYYAGGTPNVKGIEDSDFKTIWQRVESLQRKLAKLRQSRYPDLFR